MAKVTYLLGAGASFHSIPVVRNLPNLLDKIFHLFTNYPDIPQYKEPIVKIINECFELKENVKEHASFDTYAKKLWLRREFSEERKKFLIAKTILSFAFIYWQFFNKIDPRYDTFFASTLKNSFNDFNNDIRIISWNYDFQLEKAYREYSNIDDLLENQATLNVIPPLTNFESSNSKFSICKLNGTTSFSNLSDDNFSKSFQDLSKYLYPEDWEGITGELGNLFKERTDTLNRQLLDSFCKIYNEVVEMGTAKCLLSFCWETMSGESTAPTIIDQAIKRIKYSDILVVIGYSFPFFNRDIDRQILSNIGPLKKIYIQDIKCENVINNLISVMPGTWSKNIIEKVEVPPDETVNNLSQFYLPAEL